MSERTYNRLTTAAYLAVALGTIFAFVGMAIA